MATEREPKKFSDLESHRGLVYLFQRQLVDHLDVENPNILSCLNGFVDATALREVREQFEQDRKLPYLATELLCEKLKSCTNPDWFFNFLGILVREKPRIFNMISMAKAFDSLHLNLILTNVQNIVHNMDPDRMAADLYHNKCYPSWTRDDILLECQTRGPSAGSRKLIQELTLYHPEWFWIFMDTLQASRSVVHTKIANTIMPNYDEAKTAYEEGKRTMRIKTPPIPDWSYGYGITNKDEEVEVDYPEPEILQLRNYQTELATPAMKGTNCIICAPTGSGKTIVAAKIIADHLERLTSNGLVPKVAFFVPTVHLVSQQLRVFQKYIDRNSFKMRGIRGGTIGVNESPRTQQIDMSDVVVLTPMLLINALGVENSPVKLTDFSLFIFDECHHCDKLHPYNMLMTQYLTTKRQSHEYERAMPQVVGLSAALGVGKSDTTLLAMTRILEMCSRLDASKLVTVKDNKQELEDCVTVPRDEFVEIAMSIKSSPFYTYVSMCMTKVEKHLKQLADMLPDDVSEDVEAIRNIPDDKDKSTEIYTSWLGPLLVNVVPRLRNAVLKQNLSACLHHLEAYHKALVLQFHAPYRQAMEFLEGEFQIFCKECEMIKTTNSSLFAFRQKLLDIYNDFIDLLRDGANSEFTNPLVDRLKTTLRNEYFPENNGGAISNSRTLIFVQTRELTLALQRCLREEKDLIQLNPGRLVSANVVSKAGLTQQEQEQTIREFKNGRRKVIIATTVAEEGLDIQACNLVIKYNHVTNTVAMIQRRGRGRAEGSRSILLAAHGSIADKELENIKIESVMRSAMIELNKMTTSEFKKNIGENQEKTLKKMLIDEKERQNRELQLVDRQSCRVLCKVCETYFCDSTDIKLITDNHYVMIKLDIWSKIVVEPKHRALEFEDIRVVGKGKCRKCQTDLGGVIRAYHTAHLPTVKAEYFLFEGMKDGTRCTPRKWSHVTEKYFLVSKATNEDISKMALANLAPSQLEAFIPRNPFA